MRSFFEPHNSSKNSDSFHQRTRPRYLNRFKLLDSPTGQYLFSIEHSGKKFSKINYKSKFRLSVNLFQNNKLIISCSLFNIKNLFLKRSLHHFCQRKSIHDYFVFFFFRLLKYQNTFYIMIIILVFPALVGKRFLLFIKTAKISVRTRETNLIFKSTVRSLVKPPLKEFGLFLLILILLNRNYIHSFPIRTCMLSISKLSTNDIKSTIREII